MNPILTHLSRVIEICEKATPGPWELLPDAKGVKRVVYSPPRLKNVPKTQKIYNAHVVCQHKKHTQDFWASDAEFIAHARTSLPQLAKALQRAIEWIEVMDQSRDFFMQQEARNEISALLGLAGE